MNDGGAGVLAEGEYALDGSFRVAQELQGHILVIVGGLRVFQDGRHLLVVGAAKHELTVVERLPGHQRKGLRRHFQDGFVSELGGLYQFLGAGNLVVFSGILTKLKHGCVFEICHIVLLFVVFLQR